MPERNFQIKGMHYHADRNPHTFEPARFNVPANSIEDALKIVAEGKTTPPSRFYSATAYGLNEEGHPVNGRYISAEAARDVWAIIVRNGYEKNHGGLLMDINPNEFHINSRIELRKKGSWVPLEELTESGWVQIPYD